MPRDLDDLCAYKTDVKVLIRHKTVGCLYYLCMLAILGGYVIGYEYVIKGGWGAMVAFAGSLRATGKSSAVLAPINAVNASRLRLFPKTDSSLQTGQTGGRVRPSFP